MLSELVEAYSKVSEVHHNIKWWAVIMSGALIMQTVRMYSSRWFADLPPSAQRGAVFFSRVAVMPFCIMLILIQFKGYWYPFFEWAFEAIGNLL